TRWPRDWSSDVCSSDLKCLDCSDVGHSVLTLELQNVHLPLGQAVRSRFRLCFGLLPIDESLQLALPSQVVGHHVSSGTLVDRPRSEERRVGKEWRAWVM